MSSILNKNNIFFQNILLKDTVKNWLMYLEITFTRNTFECYRRDLLIFFEFFYKENPDQIISLPFLENLSIAQLRKWLVFLQDKRVGPCSRARALSAVRSFFKYCNENGLLNDTMLRYVSSPKFNKSLPKDLQINDIDFIISFVLKAKQKPWIIKRNLAAILLMYGAGMRIGEVVNLKVSDIKFSSEEIVICGKGGKERVVPLLLLVSDQIQSYIKDCPYITNENSFLFWGLRGNRMHRTSFANIIQNIRNMLLLPSTVTPHTFRHSFATHLLNNGVSIRVIQDLLGHSSLSSTQIYTNVNYSYKISEYNKSHPMAKDN